MASYDNKNIEHLYRWCIIAHEFYETDLERIIQSGDALTEIWNKETEEWEVVKSITPEYLRASAAETREIIEKVFFEKDFLGLKYIQKDQIEEFGHGFDADTISDLNKKIEKEIGFGTPKVKYIS